MKLTKEWLKEAATISSLYKGDDYYEEVAELKKEQNKYTAIVYGDIIYDVQIEENDLDIDCFCTCDFDTGGLCAHAVAVCMNILDNQYEEIEFETKADLDETITLIDYRIKDGKNFFQNIFQPAEKIVRNNFLQQLFEQNELLRKNFIALLQNKEKFQVSIDVPNLRKHIFNQLVSIDFIIENELLTITENSNTIRQQLLQEERAIEKIERVLNPYGEKALEYLEQGQLANAFGVFLGMFEASFGLPEPEWVAEPIIDNFESETIDICQNWLENLIENIANISFNEDQQFHCIDLIFDRWQVYHNAPTSSTIYYDLKFFEPFLRAILTPSSAHYLKDLLTKNKLHNFQTAQISMHCAQLLGQSDWWLEIGENYAGNDPKIAQKLMEQYIKLNQTEDFYRIARFTFSLFPDKLTGFLLKHIHPKVDRNFYIELLKYYTNYKQDIEAFKELREFISPEDKANFIEDNITNPAFYAKLLASELRFSEILVLAKEQQHSWEFNALIRPIMSIYPRDIFEMLTRRTIENLTLSAASQSDYSRICKNLHPLKEIKGMDIEKKEFIKRLKKQFKNKPTFLKELQRAGF